ncbi:MAG: F0F1 ATP synthase subunit A [Proteobacteria bacterium]|nr:F0F1 ATP synthase subunit A [Pseudomonadota bacterium]
MADPLHQFVIEPIVPLNIGGVDVSFTNSSLWMMASIGVSFVLFNTAMRRKALVPGRLQVLVEMFYQMVSDMVKSTIGPEGRRYFPLIFTIFMLVLMGNLLGLIPYSFTYTSHIIVTAALSFMIFLAVVVIGLARHGVHFLSLFAPAGVPVILYPFLVPIEIISYIARPITHSVRLFANMMAGHIMLKVFAGFSVALITTGAVGVAASAVPVLVNAALIAFELLIALLQAYVFAILACIYLKDTVEIAH